MVRYAARKATGWLAMIVVATNVTYFLASWFLDPRSNYRNQRPPRTDEQIAAALAPYGLDPDEPLLRRWWGWLTDVVLHFDWGSSPNGSSVNGAIGFRILVSGQLIAAGVVLSVLIGVGLGVYTASRQYGWADRIGQTVSIVLFNVPTAVSALALVLLAVWANQRLGHQFFLVAGSETPGIEGTWNAVADRLVRLIVPTANLTLLGYVGYHLTQRALLLDTINADFVRTARATGLTRAQAIRRHALRASLIPTATSVAFSIPAIFTGAIITETVFGWRGMGSYFTETIALNDVHGVVAVAAFGAAATAAGAILADVATAVLDPRVRVS